ncbi:MAG: neutral zinc metallopeptidase [Acidimicrobiia bacterium]|nr:neutral zinc metallopeptidase [Acidimicrobiia bacterium]
MKWRGRRQSENVDDRRRQGGSSRIPTSGKIGIPAILAILAAVLLGGNLGGAGGLDDILGQLNGVQPQQAPAQDPALDDAPDPDADLAAFMGVVLASTEDLWANIFGNADRQYRPAPLVMFSGSTQSACGGANSRVGPHYCPPDQTIYIDLDFFRDLSSQFQAPGDFAQAYVVAHEVGHHVQNLLGISDEVRQLQQSRPDDANELSVRLELQADCFAGIWAYGEFTQDFLEPGDIEEALGAASAVGDDRIQEKSTGMINPETWTHGSSAQRVEWFRAGFDSGDPNVCDTFGNDF